MTRALTVLAVFALGSALAAFVVGTPTVFGVSLAVSMVCGVAADLTRVVNR
jgi:hypothetical protein